MVETITLSEGEVKKFSLKDGDTLSNKFIDQSAEGAHATVTAIGNPEGWEISNVGFYGTTKRMDIGGWGGWFQGSVSGKGLIKNVFIDNRAPEGQKGQTSIGGFLCPQHHNGKIDVRQTFIAGCGNNAFYGSNPGKDNGENGTVTFENCYHRDNSVSQFRIGTPGSYVRNCVAVVDDPNGRRGHYPNAPNSRRARGIWARHYDNMVVENSSFAMSPADPDAFAAFQASYLNGRSLGERCTLKVIDSHLNSDAPRKIKEGCVNCDGDKDKVVFQNLGNNPNFDRLNAGVPMTAEMASKGNNTIPGASKGPVQGGSGLPEVSEHVALGGLIVGGFLLDRYYRKNKGR